MPHTIQEKRKLLDRVRRIRGQVEAGERALEEEKGCAAVLHIVVAVHNAILMHVTAPGGSRMPPRAPKN
jgi:DNA-binding FrmR family transcriptional regulator